MSRPSLDSRAAVGLLVFLVGLYLLFDVFYWDGGLVDPSVITHLDELME